jgi:uncharacterized protein (TIGR00661 family)
LKLQNFKIIYASKGKYLQSDETEHRKLRILVAPLDWGLGHATRCIPIISELVKQGCDVQLAGEGAQEQLLKQEFPDLAFLPLKGYRVRYSRSSAMVWNMLGQSSKIIKAIKDEHLWLKERVDEHGFDAVISDNRYGLYHDKIPCIFITHQLTIKTPVGKWAEKFLQAKNYKYINRFSACWVPDYEGDDNLAGDLSHPARKPAIPINYIGPLSRFDAPADSPSASSGHLLIILSGPEPQRTLFEDKIVKDIAHYDRSATVVRGLPGSAKIIPSTNSIRIYNHLPGRELNKEMNEASFIISRSGYSTVMDVTKVQKKAVLVPTPGQTEQEYLAHYLAEKKIAASTSQKTFSIPSALQLAESFPYVTPAIEPQNSLTGVVAEFVQALHKH